jgi:REP element-mobilizing transposase RayT
MLKQRKQIRLKNYDYSQSGLYYVTICTQNREYLFGNVLNGKMELNDFGKIINDVLFTIQKHFDHVELDEFVIMPNHIHGIVIIVGAGSSRPILGKIIGYFKYKSTKRINDLLGSENPTPTIKIKKIFQRNYYEHVIRNENELIKIREYIKNNPLFWNRDINFKYV